MSHQITIAARITPARKIYLEHENAKAELKGLKMISMRQISVPTLMLQRSDRDLRIVTSNRIRNREQRKLRCAVVESFRHLQQGPSSEYSYRQAFAKA